MYGSASKKRGGVRTKRGSLPWHIHVPPPPDTNITDLYRFLAEDCGYIPQKSNQSLC